MLTDDAVRFGDELETAGAPVAFGELSERGLAHLVGVDDRILMDDQLRRLTAVDLQDPPVLLALVVTDKVEILEEGWRRWWCIRTEFATFCHLHSPVESRLTAAVHHVKCMLRLPTCVVS